MVAPTAARLGADDVVVDPVSWMTAPGPWSVPDVAAGLARRIEAAGRGPVLLAGHSTGGAIAGWLAAARPDLVSALLLVDTGVHMRGHGDVDAIIDRLAAAWGPETVDAVLRRSFATAPPDDVAEELRRYAAGVPRQAALDVLRSQRDLDLTDHLAAVTCPAAVVHGVHDRARSADDARAVAAALGGAPLHWADCGHTPVFEAPDVVAGAVRDLLRRS